MGKEKFAMSLEPSAVRVKQVIIIRKDLGMRRGKEIAQGSHASMNFLVEPLRHSLGEQTQASSFTISLNEYEKHWILHGMAKICLRVESEAQLLEIHSLALAAGLQSHLIRDSGRTEFKGQPTYTACSIGPDQAEKIDRITGELKPY
jgi:peptidyl-tRNA hydrolase, PTH2 family